MVEDSGARCFPAGWNVAPKPCDSCKSAAALLFCRKDTVFLCMACDVNHTRHERVWMCELCEQSPAFVTCKAEAAALCVTCDRDIHAANPLAKRHERIPVDPFYVSAEDVVKITAGNVLDPVAGYGVTELNNWGIPTITTDIDVEFRSDTSPADMKPIDIFSEIGRVFDFGFAVPTEVILGSHFHDSVNDGVVPVQRVLSGKDFPPPQIVDHQPPGNQYAIDFPKLSTTDSYNKNSSQSHGHSVSSTSINTGVVPEQSPMLDILNPYLLRDNGRFEPNGGTNGTYKATSMDRMARVLRYREKRKNRKFEKKIRYASRKAYAEKRPRIKGRFVKRTESTTELDADRWLFTAASSCNSYGVEVEYGVVPSF